MDMPDPGEEPPRGPPWDLPFAECPFAFLDCEMTGMDPERDALVEVAVTRVRDGRVEASFETLVRAGVPSVPGALALHGIDGDALVDAPPFEAVAPRLRELLDGAVPVAHGHELDVAFLDRALAAAGRPERVGTVIDTVALARRAVHARSYSLSALAETFALGEHRWHRAGEDVRALVELFGRLAEVFRPATARELWEVRVGHRGPVRVRSTFDALFTRVQGTGRPVTLLARTPGRAPFTLVARVDRWTLPYVQLALGARGNRGTRLLRADRILFAQEGVAAPERAG